MTVKDLTEGIQAVRKIQRRRDMEKAKKFVFIVFGVVVFPIACSTLVRKFEKKFD